MQPSSTSWLAAPSLLQTRETVRVRDVASVQSDRASSDALPERPHVRGAVHLFPIHQGNTVRSPVASRPVVASFAPPSPAHRGSLLMWPPSRLLWPSSRSAACARVGVLGRRGFALETAAARVCREAGGRVMTNMFVRELDLAPGVNTTDGRRLEVVADGSSLFQGAQLAIDTTLVSALRADGTPRLRAAATPGAALDDARTRKETLVPSSLARVSGPSWSSWLQKSADVEQHSSLVRWRRPKHGQRQRLCKRRWRTLDGTVGEGCWLAPRGKLSQVLCLSTALLSLLQVTSRLCTT